MYVGLLAFLCCYLSRNNSDCRILFTLIMDPAARPSPKDMKLWVDFVRFIKSGAKGGALGFFTYAELSEFPLVVHHPGY